MSYVLIVEDDNVQHSFLEQTIQNEYPNWDIDTAGSLSEASFLLQDANHNYSLFLLDIQLSQDTSDRGGFQLAQQIRSVTVTSVTYRRLYANYREFLYSYFLCTPA